MVFGLTNDLTSRTTHADDLHESTCVLSAGPSRAQPGPAECCCEETGCVSTDLCLRQKESSSS